MKSTPIGKYVSRVIMHVKFVNIFSLDTVYLIFDLIYYHDTNR